jgi:excisionase family DNA binding protein
MDSRYLSINDLSAYLGIKPKTIYAKVKEIPHYKVGRLIRFRKDEVDAWMMKHRVGEGENDQDEKQGHGSSTPTTDPALESPRTRRSRKRRSPITDIDRMISKAIDQVKVGGYTASHGKSDQVKGSGKEV